MAEVINTVKMSIHIEYKDDTRRKENDVSLLRNPRIHSEFEILYVNSKYQDELKKPEFLIEKASMAIEEAYKMFTSLGKKTSDLRLTVSFTKGAHDKEYHSVGKEVYRSFWLVKSYAFSKEVVVRRSIPDSLWSTNSEGEEQHTEYQGKELNRVMTKEKELFLVALMDQINQLVRIEEEAV